MASYLEKFKAMVAEIESHPLLEVVQFCVNPPASDEVFAAVEEKLAAPLAESIRSFYQEANGFRLYWKIKSGMTDAELDAIEEEYDDYDIGLPDEDSMDENQFAHIQLIPLEDCIIGRNWKGTIVFEEIKYGDEPVEFAGVTYPELELRRMFRPFDLYNTYSCMAFFLEKGVENPKVLRLGDHYAGWNDSRITDFESYLEMLFVTKGIADARNNIYHEYRGHKKPPLLGDAAYWSEKYIPKLFRKK